MKVGDLVELSQLGSSKHWRKNLIGLHGIVTGFRPVSSHWEVSWLRKSGTVGMRCMERKEIRFVRAPKK